MQSLLISLGTRRSSGAEGLSLVLSQRTLVFSWKKGHQTGKNSALTGTPAASPLGRNHPLPVIAGRWVFALPLM